MNKLITAALTLVAGGALAPAAQGAPTVTDTYNTCQGMTKPQDVDYRPRCHNVRVTYSTKIKVVAKSWGSGSYPIADTQTEVAAPLGLYVRVLASPRQRRNVIWTVDCQRNDDGAFASGSYDTRTSKRRQLRMPVKNADSCTFGALASMSRGTIRLRLLARVRDKVIKREVLD